MTIRVVRTRHYEGTIWEVARTDDNMREYVAHRRTLGDAPFGVSCFVPHDIALGHDQLRSWEVHVRQLLRLPDDAVVIDGGAH